MSKMIEDTELLTTFLSALRVAKCKNMHEGFIILKTFIAILIDVLDCDDVATVNAFWTTGINAVEHIVGGEPLGIEE